MRSQRENRKKLAERARTVHERHITESARQGRGERCVALPATAQKPLHVKVIAVALSLLLAALVPVSTASSASAESTSAEAGQGETPVAEASAESASSAEKPAETQSAATDASEPAAASASADSAAAAVQSSTPAALENAATAPSASAPSASTGDAQPQASAAVANSAALEQTLTAQTADGAYTVQVSYGADAAIPEGAALCVVVFAESSLEYAAAHDALVASLADPDGDGAADLSAEDAQAQAGAMNMAALDIRINDASGNQVEPAQGAKVSVKITAAQGALPESAIAESVQVRHVKDGAAPTVALVDPEDGETQDALASANAGDTAALPMGAVTANDDGTTTAEFQTTSFSTYAVTSEAAADNSLTYSVAAGGSTNIEGMESVSSDEWESSDEGIATVTGSGSNATVTGISKGTATITHTYYYYKKKNKTATATETFTVEVTAPASTATITLHYVDSEGKQIQDSTTVSESASFDAAVNGYALDSAHLGSAAGSTVTNVAVDAANKSVTFYNGSDQVDDAHSYADESYTADVYLVYESESTQEVSRDDYTVTVKGNIPKGTTLVVDQADTSATGAYADYFSRYTSDLGGNYSESTGFDFLRFYHIYLKDANGNEYVPAKKLNLHVTITYTTTPSGWDKVASKGAYVAHYKKNASGAVEDKGLGTGSGNDVSLGVKQIKVSGNSISFHLQSFSVLAVGTPAAATAQTSIDTGTTGDDNSIMNNFSYGTANQWQVVSGLYAGSKAANKTTYSDDGNVRVQKNVLPAGTENEFYVYLSVDTRAVNTSKKRVDTWLEKNAKYVCGSSNHFTDAAPGEVTTVHGQVKAILDYDATSGTHVIIRHNGVVIGETWVKCTVSNPSFYLWTSTSEPNKKDKCIALAETNGTNSATIDTDLTDEAYEMLMSAVSTQTSEESIALKTVTDQMGPNISFEDAEKGDYSAAPTVANGTLTWKLKPKSSPKKAQETKTVTTEKGTTTTQETWSLNVAELVYKVRYTPTSSAGLSTSDGSVQPIDDQAKYGNTASGKSAVNASATLTYVDSLTPDDVSTVVFPVPEVRGMLYEIHFKKVSDSGKALQGATFTLYSDKDCKVPVKNSKGKDLTATSDGNGHVGFYNPGLQCGTYWVKETEAPAGYELDNTVYKFTVSYTTNASDLQGRGYGVDAIYKARDDTATENEVFYTDTGSTPRAPEVHVFTDVQKFTLPLAGMEGDARNWIAAGLSVLAATALFAGASGLKRRRAAKAGERDE